MSKSLFFCTFLIIAEFSSRHLNLVFPRVKYFLPKPALFQYITRILFSIQHYFNFFRFKIIAEKLIKKLFSPIMFVYDEKCKIPKRVSDTSERPRKVAIPSRPL
jgi:hypothetical protein